MPTVGSYIITIHFAVKVGVIMRGFGFELVLELES